MQQMRGEGEVEGGASCAAASFAGFLRRTLFWLSYLGPGTQNHSKPQQTSGMATASKIGHKNSYVANYNNDSVDDGNEEANEDEEVDGDDGDGIACSSLALSSFGDSIRV
ncbi:hypothetical protein ACLKA6_016621 [Drosophila palustris]